MSRTLAQRRERPAVRLAPPIVHGRVPPHDLDAEAAVLAAILLSREALDRVQDVLKPEHFYSDANALIYEAAQALAQAGSPIDIVAVASYLRDRERLARIGGPSYLAQLADATPAVAHVAAHAAVVFAKWRQRAIIATCQRIAAEGYGDVGDLGEFIDRAESDIYALAHVDGRREMRHMRDAIRDDFAGLVAATERGDTLIGYATGYRDLDERLAGLCPGDLTLIAARPGMGKTAAAQAFATYMAEPRTARASAPSGEGYVDVPNAPGYGVCFFGLEMPESQTVQRFVCADARVDLNRRRRPQRLDARDWRELTISAQRLASLPIWLDDSTGLTLLELRAKVRRRQAEYDLDEAPGRPARKIGLVVVDYLQLMAAPEGIVSREQQVAALSRGLKAMAKELHVPVIALAQLNREVETRSKDKRPQLSDLRESGSLEQDADNVILVYRDDYYHPDSRERGIAEWIVAKARNGLTGTVKVRWTGSSTRFDQLAPGERRDEDDDA